MALEGSLKTSFSFHVDFVLIDNIHQNLNSCPYFVPTRVQYVHNSFSIFINVVKFVTGNLIKLVFILNQSMWKIYVSTSPLISGVLLLLPVKYKIDAKHCSPQSQSPPLWHDPVLITCLTSITGNIETIHDRLETLINKNYDKIK